MEYVARIHLKTGESEEAANKNRAKVIDYCLSNKDNQYLVIGWSYIYENNKNIKNFKDFYEAVAEDTHKRSKKIDSAFNLFWYAKKDDLFWTRDLEGYYWICKAKGEAQIHYNKVLDIGAQIPVEAYKYGLEEFPGIPQEFAGNAGSYTEAIRRWTQRLPSSWTVCGQIPWHP